MSTVTSSQIWLIGMFLLILPTLKSCMSGFIDLRLPVVFFFHRLKYVNHLNFIVAAKMETKRRIFEECIVHC